jgi:hypothetical protein
MPQRTSLEQHIRPTRTFVQRISSKKSVANESPQRVTANLLAKTSASERSSAVFFGRAASRRAIARYLSGRGGSATFQIRPATAPRKDTLRISLAQLADLRFSALCSQNTPTSSGGKSGDHISTALILHPCAGNWAHRHPKNLLPKMPASD